MSIFSNFNFCTFSTLSKGSIKKTSPLCRPSLVASAEALVANRHQHHPLLAVPSPERCDANAWGAKMTTTRSFMLPLKGARWEPWCMKHSCQRLRHRSIVMDAGLRASRVDLAVRYKEGRQAVMTATTVDFWRSYCAAMMASFVGAWAPTCSDGGGPMEGTWCAMCDHDHGYHREGGGVILNFRWRSVGVVYRRCRLRASLLGACHWSLVISVRPLLNSGIDERSGSK